MKEGASLPQFFLVSLETSLLLKWKTECLGSDHVLIWIVISLYFVYFLYIDIGKIFVEVSFISRIGLSDKLIQVSSPILLTLQLIDTKDL